MIDMHIHTKYSDGTYTVKEVLEKAEKLVSAYKKAVETILKDLPADMVIENNKGICYRIIKKCDKDYLSFYSNSVLRSNK